MAEDATQYDFLGEGTAAPAQAPAMTAAEVEEARRRKIEWLRNQGLDENGQQLPAYGTSQGQGGTATGFQVATQPVGASGQVGDVWTAQLGANDVVMPGAPITERQYAGGRGPSSTAVVGSIVPGQDLVGSMAASPLVGSQAGISVASDGTTTLGGGSPGGGVTVGAPGMGSGRGALLGAQTAQGTTELRADIERRRQASEDQMNATAAGFNGSPLTNPNATNQAANQAEGALGAAPTIDQGLADRGRGDVTGALGMQRTVYDQLLNGPNTAQRLGSQVLRNQLALARSAAGGPGAVQEALRNAQMQAPELQAAAAQAATAETLQRTQAAGNVAQGVGQTALGARGQDVSIAAANQQAASQLMQNVTQLTGQQLELDQRNQELLGQMARDLAAQNFNWGQLDAQAQNNEFERWIKTYGIDVAAAAQIRAAAANNDKGVMDYLIPIIGSAAQLGMAAL